MNLTPEILVRKLREIVRGTENVGRRFPEEARKIHYNEVPPRPIRGQASRDEAQALTRRRHRVRAPAAVPHQRHALTPRAVDGRQNPSSNQRLGL